MKNWHKILLGLFILGIVGATLGYVFIYNKPHRDYEKAKADFSKTAEAFFEEYKNDKDQAQQTYNGKVLEVTGKLTHVETADSLTIAVFALAEGLFGDEGIRCAMLPNHAQKVKDLEGRAIVLKGYCTGYNDTDVIMEKCSVVTMK
ncbi:MAG: hypothetical protein KDC05_13855 [Bacteroidales bacterium]|nr:hypothetical protein [Bacteroidales bacterium]